MEFIYLLRGLQGTKESIKVNFWKQLVTIKAVKKWMKEHFAHSRAMVYYLCKAINLEDDPFKKINFVYLISAMLHHTRKLRNEVVGGFATVASKYLKELIYPAYICQSDKTKLQIKTVLSIVPCDSLFLADKLVG